MPTVFVPSSTSDQWITGHVYRITYDVDHIKLFGWDVPDELIPDSIREYLQKKQINQTIERMRDDPRYEVLGYQYEGRTFTVDLLARDNPIPVGLIVGAVIALALLFGIALVTTKVEKLVDSTDKLVNDIGPVGTTLGIGTIAAIVGLGAFIYIRGRA